MEQIKNMPTVASNIEVWLLALNFMDKYQEAFEALAESEASSDEAADRPNCSE